MALDWNRYKHYFITKPFFPPITNLPCSPSLIRTLLTPEEEEKKKRKAMEAAAIAARKKAEDGDTGDDNLSMTEEEQLERMPGYQHAGTLYLMTLHKLMCAFAYIVGT